MNRICIECGTTFTLDDAISIFSRYVDGISYMSQCAGDLCAECAMKQLDDEAYYEEEEYEEEFESSVCDACGNPAYPDCMSGCKLFDD